MLGIQDPYVLAAYLLCIASTVLCVLYALVMRNRGEQPTVPDDVHWVQEEKKVEEEL